MSEPEPAESASAAEPAARTAEPVVIRLPRTAYLAVVLLVAGTVPFAFGTGSGRALREQTKSDFGADGFVLSWRLLLLLVPITVAFFIARTATVVSRDGLRVRALFGSRNLAWTQVRGLAVQGRAVYAVIADGAVRLPCVRIAHLGPISRLSAGHVPELPDATPKPAPQRRRRR